MPDMPDNTISVESCVARRSIICEDGTLVDEDSLRWKSNGTTDNRKGYELLKDVLRDFKVKCSHTKAMEVLQNLEVHEITKDRNSIFLPKKFFKPNNADRLDWSKSIYNRTLK